MIELPEALTYARQLHSTVVGKTVEHVFPPNSPHKFCWFQGDPADYELQMKGKKLEEAEGFGIYVEIRLAHGVFLTFNDGVNVRWIPKGGALPKKYQLLILFTDKSGLAFTVAMYGGIFCGQKLEDNSYYKASRERISPLSPHFTYSYFEQIIREVKSSLSLKAFLATEQRIPGLGNGCLQDILLWAGMHPKTKINQLSMDERLRLYESVKQVMGEMEAGGGRDTEKDLYGNPGGYRTKLSRNTLADGCPKCGGAIVKGTYMGGAIYYCTHCQKIS